MVFAKGSGSPFWVYGLNGQETAGLDESEEGDKKWNPDGVWGNWWGVIPMRKSWGERIYVGGCALGLKQIASRRVVPSEGKKTNMGTDGH